MAVRDNAVFRYVLEIGDFIKNNRIVVQSLNKLKGETDKTSMSVENLGNKTKQAGTQSAAAAVNFQTLTQGMLNLTTAGVQTFTSFSNLDRAANRLAQAQVGLARAEDLLNNKQLRLNELREKGLGHSAKAIQLEKELGTARADLLVKTDKLRIEEGALTDIQLLFATNVANVMISSLQTIKTLKDLHIAATIKQIATEKLLSAGILNQIIINKSATATLGAYTKNTKLAVNANRLLTLSIPGIGIALAGLTVGVQAYNENWGGFRDGLQSVFPLLKDHKDLLRQTKEEMAGANGEFTKYNDSLSDNGKELDRLPMRYDLLIGRIKKLREEAALSATQTEKLNIEIGKIPADFRSPSNGGLVAAGGTFQQIGGPTRITSNVVRTEGDASFTAKGISSSSVAIPTTNDFIKLASAGVLTTYNPKMMAQAKKEFGISSNQKLVFERGGLYDLFNIFDSQTTGGTFTRQFMNVWADNFSIVGKGLSKGISMAKTGIDKSVFETNFALRRAFGDLAFQFPYAEDVYKFIGGSFPTVSDAKNFVRINQINTNRLQNALSFQANIDKYANFYDTMIYPWDKKIPKRLGFSSSIFRGGTQLLGEAGRESILRTGTPQEQLDFLLSEGRQMGLNIETEEDAFRYLLAIEQESDFLKGFTAVYSDPNIPIAGEIIKTLSQKEFFEKTATERAERFKKAELFKIAQKKKASLEFKLIAEAAGLGISTDDLIFRRGIGGSKTRPGLGFDILRYGLDPTEEQLKFLESSGRLARFQYGNPTGPISTDYAYEFVPRKVKEAWAIRDQQLAGNNLVDNTPHDRLVKAAFGARNMFGPGHRLGGFKFGSAGGTLNMAYSGLILSKDDPLLKDTSNMGETQLAVFMETGVDIGGVAETIGKKEALRIAHLEKQIQTFANTTGGFSSAAISYLNMVGKTNEWGKSVADNNIRSHMANIYRTGDTSYFGSGFFKSSGATAAYQVARGSIRVAWREAQIQIEDRNRNRLKTGGRRVLNEDGTPMYDLWDDRAVEGGFTSVSAYRQDWWKSFRSRGQEALSFIGALGGDTSVRFAAGGGKAALNRTYSRAISQATETRSLLARTGLSISMLPSFGSFGFKRAGGGFGNVSIAQANRMRASISNRYQAAVSATIAANQLTLKRAGQIDLLIGGFGLDSYYGSGLGLQQLQLAVQKQDELIQSIGLNRTEAFRIIDTQGRGRNEIEDRVRWTQRNESISTGNIVL